MVESPLDPRSPQSRGVILAFYPAPIAHAFYRAANASEGSVDLAYGELQSVLLAYLSLVALRAAPATDPVVQETLKRLCSKNAAGGDWLRALRETCAHIGESHLVQILGVHAADGGSFARSSLHVALEEIVALRNAVMKQGRYDQRPAWQRAIHHTLELLSDLRSQAILVPRVLKGKRDKVRVYHAAAYQGTAVRYPITIETDLEFVPGHAYLWRAGYPDLLELHPLVVELAPEGGGPLHQLFVLKNPSHSALSAIEDGEDATPEQRAGVVEALDDLSAALAGSSAWLTPSRFSCPSLNFVSGRQLSPGDRVAGRYTIQGLLGSGATADVYAARDEVSGAEIALKLMPFELARDPDLTARFRKEFQAAARLEHACLVRYLGEGSDAGALFLVTELANGWAVRDERAFDLGRYLALARERGMLAPDAGLDEELVRGVLGQIAQGLAELHAHGDVHRDVKPSNVFLFEDAAGGDAASPAAPARRVKLGDFGTVRQRGSATMTLAGFPLGTAEYMPLEQAGDDEVVATMDVYSFGVMAYELLAGEPPFRGRTPQETRERHRRRLEPLAKRVPGVSPGLARLVEDCLRKDPSRRPANGGAIFARMAELDRALEPHASTVDIARGQRLGHYRIQEPEAEIAGATLFGAVDERTGSRVRVGILASDIEHDEARREAVFQLLATLQAVHKESLVRVREYGEADGFSWFLLEDGGEAVDAAAVPMSNVLAIARSALGALAALHALGIQHGNVAAAIRKRRSPGPAGTATEPAGMLDVPALVIPPGRAPREDLRELVDWLAGALDRARPADPHAKRAGARLLWNLRAFDASSETDAEFDRLLERAQQDFALRGLARGPWYARRALAAGRRHPLLAATLVVAILATTGLSVGPIVYARYQRSTLREDVRSLTAQGLYSEARLQLESRAELIGDDPELVAYDALMPVFEEPRIVTPEQRAEMHRIAVHFENADHDAQRAVERVVIAGKRRLVTWIRTVLEDPSPWTSPDRERLWWVAERSFGALYNDAGKSGELELRRVQDDVIAIALLGLLRKDTPRTGRGATSVVFVVNLARQSLYDRNEPNTHVPRLDDVQVMHLLGERIRAWPAYGVYESECYSASTLALEQLALGTEDAELADYLHELAHDRDLQAEYEKLISALQHNLSRADTERDTRSGLQAMAVRCEFLESCVRNRIGPR